MKKEKGGRTLKDRLKEISLLVLDVDGVLTDGGVWWGVNGEEIKRFSFADVMGVSLARRAGLRVALVSGEDNAIVDRFAQKMGITDVYKKAKDKAACVRDLLTKHGVQPETACYVGDDVNDIPAFQIVGLPVAVSNANSKVFPHVTYRTARAGGDGAVREVVDLLLEARSRPLTSV